MAFMSETELCNRINKDLAEKKLIQVVCSCSIEYSGRSRSSIGLGHRLLIIKPDSTLLIHSVTGFKPINWMRAPTETIAEYCNQKLILRNQRTQKPYEEMQVTIEEILDYHTRGSLRDNTRQELTHTEKDLQEYLTGNPELVHPEFRLKSREYKTPIGNFDLYGKIRDTYVVVELKSERAGLPAALQIKRYRDWLKQHIQKTHAILVAPGITPNARTLLNKEKIEYKKIRTQDLNIKKKRNKTLKEWS